MKPSPSATLYAKISPSSVSMYVHTSQILDIIKVLIAYKLQLQGGMYGLTSELDAVIFDTVYEDKILSSLLLYFAWADQRIQPFYNYHNV